MTIQITIKKNKDPHLKGWIKFDNKDAHSDRFRSGFLYAITEIQVTAGALVAKGVIGGLILHLH